MRPNSAEKRSRARLDQQLAKLLDAHRETISLHKHGLYTRLERLRADGITPADGQYQVEQQHSAFMTERITEDTITAIRQRLQTYNNAIAQQTGNQLAAQQPAAP
ncbi:MAG: hypothetical protein OXG78_06950 [Chloroflexi bacterium]|nr:hypothetical protein [Chloroflexota bacterium]